MLLKDRLRQMFEPFPPDVQRVLDEVLDLEQRRISYERPPHIKDDINEIITAVAQNQVAKAKQTDFLESAL